MSKASRGDDGDDVHTGDEHAEEERKMFEIAFARKLQRYRPLQFPHRCRAAKCYLLKGRLVRIASRRLLCCWRVVVV